jgi:hypothetical protein
MELNELKDFKALSEPLLCHRQVRAMYDTVHQMLLRVVKAQGFGDPRENSAAAEVYGCRDGAELLGWEELFDSHSNQMLLLMLTLSIHLAGSSSGLCRLTVRIYYPDDRLTTTNYDVLHIPAAPGFEASERALTLLAQQVLACTSQDEAWASRAAVDFTRWLEHETTA